MCEINVMIDDEFLNKMDAGLGKGLEKTSAENDGLMLIGGGGELILYSGGNSKETYDMMVTYWVV